MSFCDLAHLLLIATLGPSSGVCPPSPAIATSDATIAQSSSTLEVYDVADLLVPVAWSASQPVDAAPAARSALGTRSEPASSDVLRAAPPDEAADEALASDLAAFLPLWIEPPLEERSATIRAVGGSVVVLASQEQHAWLRAFFERHRGVRDLVDLQVVYVEGPRGGFAKLGIAAVPSVTPLAQAELERLLALDAAAGFERVSSPRLTTFLLRRANLEVGTRVAYVRSWKLELVEPGPTSIADPEIDSVHEGFDFRAFAARTSESRVGLALELVRSSIARPIATRRVRLAPGSEREVEIAEPEVTRVSMTTRFEIESGVTVAFATPSNREQRDLLVLVRATLVRARADGAGSR